MLRGLVLLFVLLDVALFFWIRSDPHWGQADREPQRLQHQVAPDAIQVLPDLPAGAASAASAAASPNAEGASAADVAASSTPAADIASAPASAVTPTKGRPAVDAALLHKTSLAEPTACVESGPLDPAQWTALARDLARAGVPAGAITERRQAEPGRWIIYMGRYADASQWQHKADELTRLGLKFERVGAPAALAPGLSLGSYASADEAASHLDDLGRRGVRTARVVEAAGPGFSRRLQVHAASDTWRAAVSQRFGACPAAANASSL